MSTPGGKQEVVSASFKMEAYCICLNKKIPHPEWSEGLYFGHYTLLILPNGERYRYSGQHRRCLQLCALLNQFYT